MLNVDGCIGALFLDLLWSCGMFSEVSWRFFFFFFSISSLKRKHSPRFLFKTLSKRERERPSRPPFSFFLDAVLQLCSSRFPPPSPYDCSKEAATTNKKNT